MTCKNQGREGDLVQSLCIACGHIFSTIALMALWRSEMMVLLNTCLWIPRERVASFTNCS